MTRRTVVTAILGRCPRWAVWAGLFGFCVLAVVLRATFPWLAAFPRNWELPVAAWVNAVTMPVFTWLQPAGRAVGLMFDLPLRGIRAALQWLPWPSVFLMVGALALRASGWRLAAFSVIALGYVVLCGYWRQSMNTMAIVVMSVPLSVALGFALGALAHHVRMLVRPLEVTLDLMQTLPAFAYLIPLLLLFGFGPAAGLVASIVFAAPPMVRNTMLGLRLVPGDILESGVMSGCTPPQNFWRVKVPSALPRLLVGVNQTSMAALSMVIIVAIIGGFDDIGWEVLSAMRRAELGRSLLSGSVIVVIAILLDRITLGLATLGRKAATPLGRRGLGLAVASAILSAIALHVLMPGNDLLPLASGRNLLQGLDQALLSFVAATSGFFEALRNVITYGLMLPLRIGIAGAATPQVWGFGLSLWMLALFAAGLGATALLVWRYSWQAATAVLFAGLMFYTGLPGFPWIGFVLVVALLGRAGGGWRLAGLAAAAQIFILLSGLWLPFMQSVYLCMIAVFFCLVIGAVLGVWAAQSDRVSALLRPINDALQTMPQFVFLIPALMLFRVGEFTALIAIMLYAIVPPIRYVEHGLRNVPPQIIEAARQMGTTPRQLLWQVKVPLARPAILLGLNQTIMAALSMLVIAALVGTRDLGQQVYVALGKADPGLGLVAGLSIAAIALIADRILRGFASGAAVQKPG